MHHLDFPILEVNLGIPLYKVDIWRHTAALQSQYPFDQASNPSCTLKMADIGFDRAHHDRVVNGSDRSDTLGDSLELLPITGLRSRAMTFNVAGLSKIKTS